MYVCVDRKTRLCTVMESIYELSPVDLVKVAPVSAILLICVLAHHLVTL